MAKELTKEEFLDKKNINLIKEVRDVFELKNQLSKVTDYLNDARKNGLTCCLNSSNKVAREMGLTYWSLNLLISLVEKLKNGELVFVDKNE